MDEMPKGDVASLLPLVREQIEEAVQKIMQALNNTAPGELITGSEEAARDIGHELTRALVRPPRRSHRRPHQPPRQRPMVQVLDKPHPHKN